MTMMMNGDNEISSAIGTIYGNMTPEYVECLTDAQLKAAIKDCKVLKKSLEDARIILDTRYDDNPTGVDVRMAGNLSKSAQATWRPGVLAAQASRK